MRVIVLYSQYTVEKNTVSTRRYGEKHPIRSCEAPKMSLAGVSQCV